MGRYYRALFFWLRLEKQKAGKAGGFLSVCLSATVGLAVTLGSCWLLKIVVSESPKSLSITDLRTRLVPAPSGTNQPRKALIMTENTPAETPAVDTSGEVVTEAQASEEKPAKVVEPVENLSVLAKALVEEASGKAAELKAVAEQQAKVGDVGKLLSEAIESSENPEVKAMRVKREKAAAAMLTLDKAMEEIVKPTLNIPSEADLAAMDLKYKTLASELNTFNTVFLATVAKDHPEATLFDYVGELPGKRSGAKKGQGTGISRPRVTSVEYTTDLNGQEGYKIAGKDGKSTFSHLAMAIKSETGETISASDFTEAWTSQLGIKDWTDSNEVSYFSFPVTDKNQKTTTYTVRVTR